MFCPKCGKQLPDGAAFCGECGHQIAAAAAPPARPAASPMPTGSGAALAQNALAGNALPLGAALLTAITMLLPWLHVPIAETANGFSSLLGVEVASDYNVLGLGDAASVLSSISGDSSISTMHTLVLVVWLVALVLLVFGAIWLAIGKGKPILLAGAILAALLALVWCVTVFVANNALSDGLGFSVQAVTTPIWPYGTILLGAATAFLAAKAA